MTGVQELFSELFAYVLFFEQMTLAGEFQPSYQEVRSTITTLLAKGKMTAHNQGIPETEFQDACFAVVAWADETILRCTTWKYYNDWNAFPLQEEYFQTRLAGQELFARLKNLSTEQKDTRETYFLCLGLGFSGQYFRETDEPRLVQLRHEQARRLSRPVESVYNIDKITPQPYAVPAQVGKPVTDLWTRWLVKAGYALLVAVPMALLLLLGYLTWRTPAQFQLTVAKGGNGSGTVKSLQEGIHCGPVCSKAYTSGTVIELQAIPARGSVFSGWGGAPSCQEKAVALSANMTCTALFTLDAPAIQAAILANQPCAKVSVSLDGSTAELRGMVKSEAQRTDILNSLKSIEGVERFKDTLRTVPAHFCDIFALLEPIKKSGDEQGLGFIASLSKPGDLPVYRGGEALVITGTASTKFDSHIYIDYFDIKGSVGHLLPNDREKANRRGRGQSFKVGHGDGPNPWQIDDQPPFGIELVTVLVSKAPLSLKTKGDDEPAISYLSELRQTLSKVPAGDLAAMLLLIETSPAP